jgi:hypothetical protein
VGTAGIFPGVKRSWRKSDNALLSSANVKNEWSIIPTYGENLRFYFIFYEKLTA